MCTFEQSESSSSSRPSSNHDRPGISHANLSGGAPSSTLVLSDGQRDKLNASGISPAVVAERGYFTEFVGSQLRHLSFSRSQFTAPALVIPIHDLDGRVVLHQIRPDRPRNVNGRILKYELPTGSHLSIDVPPRVRDKIANPSVPLYITEGVLKADAAVSRGLCCIAVLGVWGWKKQEAFWDMLPLEGRQVFIVFDSDVASNRSVQQAAAGLFNLLKERKADPQLIALPPGSGSSKVGLDDYLVCRQPSIDG